MKATYLALVLGWLSGCAHPARQQAEAAVGRYLRATVHDPGSFEVVRVVSRPYSRHDSLAYAAQAASRRAARGAPTPPPPAQRPADTVRVGWLITLTYRVKNGYEAASTERGTFVVYPPDRVLPVAL